MHPIIELLLNPLRTNGDLNGVACMFYVALALLAGLWLAERSFTNKGGK